MSPTRPASVRPARRRALRPVAIALLAISLAGCSSILESSPEPTPLDFLGVQGQLANRGVVVSHITSGDAGCQDPTLVGPAIGFDASGLGVTDPIRLRIYIFADGAAFQRRRPDVDTCAAAWATDPATFEFIDASPFVIAGQGPWPDAFKLAVRAALTAAAGNGGGANGFTD